MIDEEKVVETRQNGSARICAEVDFAQHEQIFFPFSNFHASREEFSKIKSAVKNNDYVMDDDYLKASGYYMKPFVILPSVVCACQVDNVEVVKKSVIFDCDRLALCVEYIVCLKLFDKDNKPQCHEFKACFTKEIDRTDFTLIAPFSSGTPSLEDFISAEGTCVSVRPIFQEDDCFVVNKECLTCVFLDISFEVLVKLFRTHNVTVALTGLGLGLQVEKIPKEVDRCNFCFPNNQGCNIRSEK